MVNAQSRYGTLLPEGTIETLHTHSGHIYVGIDNPLKIATNDTCKDFFIGTNNGIYYTINDTLMLMPERSGKARVQLYQTCHGDTNELGYKFLTVKNLPGPKIKLNNTIIDEISQQRTQFLLQADTIKVFVSSDIIGSEKWAWVVEYELGYNFGGYYLSHKSKLNYFDTEAKRFISQITPNKILLLKVKITSFGNVVKNLPIYKIEIY